MCDRRQLALGSKPIVKRIFATPTALEVQIVRSNPDVFLGQDRARTLVHDR